MLRRFLRVAQTCKSAPKDLFYNKVMSIDVGQPNLSKTVLGCVL